MFVKNPEYFLTIAKERSISKAAEQLYLSQPYLSQYLAKLEHTLGVALMDRSHTPLTLTTAGEVFYAYLERQSYLDRQLFSDLRDIQDRNRPVLHIGVSPWRGAMLLPDILPLFTPQFPDVQVVLHEAAVPELTKLAEDSVIDFCIMHIPSDLTELSYELIMREHVFLIGHKSHPLLRGLDSPYDRPLQFTQLRQLEHERIIMLPSDWRLAKLLYLLRTEHRSPEHPGHHQQHHRYQPGGREHGLCLFAGERHLPHPLSGPACLLYHRGPAPHLPHGGGVQEKRLPLPRRPGLYRPDKGVLPAVQPGWEFLKKSTGPMGPVDFLIFTYRNPPTP